MALRKDWPAIRAKSLWDWMERGTVEVTPLFGTRVLLVAKNAQPFKTRYELKNGEIIKHPTRYWLAEGVVLVPRWDPLDIHYDPVADDGVETLGLDELKKRGMYRLNEKILVKRSIKPFGFAILDEKIIVLIYQHVEGALHFQRQQWHISLETYSKELKEISTKLREIEEHVLKSISLKEPQRKEISEELGSVERNLKQRRKKIHKIVIKGISPRQKTAEILIEGLQGQVQLTKIGIKTVLISKPVKDLIAGIPTSIEGLRAYLVRTYQGLTQIKVRPIVRVLKLAQYCLRGALGALDVGEIKRFQHQLELVIEKLEKSQRLLQQPKKKEEFLQQEQKLEQLTLLPNSKLKKGVV